MLYGKANRLWTKKIAAACRKGDGRMNVNHG
jgi:hypothetical protein